MLPKGEVNDESEKAIAVVSRLMPSRALVLVSRSTRWKQMLLEAADSNDAAFYVPKQW